jgi:hypothetical protein
MEAENEGRKERTNMCCIDDFVVFERIEIILDMYRRTFLDRTSPKEWVGCGWSLYMINVKQVKSQVQQTSLTESDLLVLGDDVDA